MAIPIVGMILSRLKVLLLHIVGCFKRALCIFGRRRRNSCDSVPLMGVGVIPSIPTNEEENWVQWGEDSMPDSIVSHAGQKQTNTVQNHIEQYRQQMAMARRVQEEVPEEQPETNYFEDMTPRLTKQKKLFIRSGKENGSETDPSLALGVQIAPAEMAKELGEWEESPGWDDEVQLDCDQSLDLIVREKRRQERERRALEQQQKRMERNQRPVPLGARIS